jgi:DNA-binding transcriptional MerR regulator
LVLRKEVAVAWSTSQLAKLAGTTVKTIRHYHEIGLLNEPVRTTNGYKQYGINHLVRLLRIKRLTDLGVPLLQVTLMGQTSDESEDALQAIDTELSETIERLNHVKAELAAILHDRARIDLPPGLDEVAPDLPDANRALVFLYSHLYGETAMAALQEELQDPARKEADAEFDSLPDDTDDAARQALAIRYAPHVHKLTTRFPWLKGAAYEASVMGQARIALYNSAQIDVLARVELILHPSLTFEADTSL